MIYHFKIKQAATKYKNNSQKVVNMNNVVHNNISSKLKNSTSENGYYSYTNRYRSG